LKANEIKRRNSITTACYRLFEISKLKHIYPLINTCLVQNLSDRDADFAIKNEVHQRTSFTKKKISQRMVKDK
jgi:hypothetical protein